MEAIITIVGFLGSGKTTLLGHLINEFNHKHWSPYVILNDYENANLDAQQFVAQLERKSIKTLTGSCICCSGIVELRNMVNRIPERKNGITLIEANGTSDAFSLMEFLAVGINERFLPPIQISVVDVKNWQQRGEHNELELNQIQVSSVIVLTHLDKVSLQRKAMVTGELKKANPSARIVTMNTINALLLPKILPSKNVVTQKMDHIKAHWASCAVDLPNLFAEKCIHTICEALPKSILRVKGCAKIGKDEAYTYFERKPDGEVFIRPFNGIPITGPKLLTIGPGSEPRVLKKVIQESLNVNV